ncbi:MAG: phenylalanine--tRNA ligase subunit beta [Gammaproteobacteria bacterium]|nr:phenylalanine--tRNA ligase subunit beta [Gammaproteobacteria bacterium]
MKYSEQWLKDWVPITVSTAQLCDQLTNAGLEVDGTESVAREFSGVFVAKVTAVEPHPNASRLSVCQVDHGAGTSTVVCGAPNVRPGLSSAFARVGAVLPDGTAIGRSDLRGVVSEGMLLSTRELGLEADADGILELDAEFEFGTDLRVALGLDDVVIDIDLTPNRGDVLSIRGLAREVGVLNRLPVSAPRIDAVDADTATVFGVEIANYAGCPRYLGRVIEGVDISRPTPWWMRERLRRSGLRPIDPAVDVTNYVLLELGQPMHAFDLDQLSGGVVVRNGQTGESMTLLDGRDIEVDETVLLITDSDGPVAMAGVMGGERSGVGTETCNVFLECAYFSPQTVARTSRRFDLHTDAAYRYARGVDCQLQAEAMERATRLLVDIAGGRPGPVVEAVSEKDLPAANRVSLRKSRLDLLVGEEIPVEEVERILDRLELSPSCAGGVDDRVWTTTSPSHRFDIAREEDLVEEVLRIHGYDAIKSRVPIVPLPLGRARVSELLDARLKDLLVDLGYAEAITYSFVEEKIAGLLDPGGDPVSVVNPVSSEHAVMRTSLLPGLVTALRNNLSRQAARVRLFETGQCFRKDADDLAQTTLCGGILFGPREREGWAHDRDRVDFFDVKGDVERLFALGGLTVGYVKAADPVLHPGQSAVVLVEGEPAGRFGRLHPEVETVLELPSGVFVFELEGDAVLARRRRRHGFVSRQPSVRRDLAVVVDREISAASIESIVRARLGKILAEFTFFDVYWGEGIDSNKKSVAIGLTFQHPSRTLTDTEIARHLDDTLLDLTRRLGVRLR